MIILKSWNTKHSNIVSCNGNELYEHPVIFALLRVSGFSW